MASGVGLNVDQLDILAFQLFETFELAIYCSNPLLKPQMRVLYAMLTCYPPV